MERYPLIACYQPDADLAEIISEELSELNYQIFMFQDIEEIKIFCENYAPYILCFLCSYKIQHTGLESFLDNEADFLGEIPLILLASHVRITHKRIFTNMVEALNSETLTGTLQTLKEREEFITEDIEILDGFLEECHPLFDSLEGHLLNLEETGFNEKVINNIFRILHTIKGTAASVHIKELAATSHLFEDFIVLVKDKELPITKSVISIMLDGLDVIKKQFENISNAEYQILNVDNKSLFKYNKEVIESEINEETSNENTGKTKLTEDKVGVPISLLNEFLELSGEMTLIRNSIQKTFQGVMNELKGHEEINYINSSINELYQVSSTLQSKISDLKKVSATQVSRLLKRGVRDVCAITGKKVNFEVTGDNLKIDTTLASILNNTLIHLIRNSIDHGIETSETRLKIGKEEAGNVTLQFRDAGEEIHVDIEDDGSGIDPILIKKKVIANGLYTEEQLTRMPLKRIYAMIFQAGFSTKEDINEISGRGVGMDMVKSLIDEVRGRIEIRSIIGKGTHFRISLPIPKSVFIIPSLIIRQNNHKFAIPLSDVVQLIMAPIDAQCIPNLQSINERQFIKTPTNLWQLVFIDEVFHTEKKKKLPRNVVIIKYNNIQCGIVVEEICDFEDVVVRPISKPLKKTKIYLGACIIGERASLVFNIEKVIDEIGIEHQPHEEDFIPTKSKLPNYDEFLLFTLQNGQHYGLRLSYVYRLEKIPKKEIISSYHNRLLHYQDAFIPLYYLGEILNIEKLPDQRSYQVIVIKESNLIYALIVCKVIGPEHSTSIIHRGLSTNKGILGAIKIKQKSVNVLDWQEIRSQFRPTLSVA